MASDRTDEDVLEEIWRAPDTSASLFSDAFLQQIPPDQIEAFVANLLERCGAFVAVERTETAGEYRLVTERCNVPAVIGRNTVGRVDRLSLYEPARRNVALDDLLEEIASFKGSVSYAIVENGELIAARDADRPLAVGSAFKLIVLAALRQSIESGESTWSDVVTLEDRHISLPSGRLQEMPVGSPSTLHTLAAAMIAESDNTATDVLIDFVGRDRLEALSNLRPFLTTREMFQLKADEGVFERYEMAELSERRAILNMLADAPLPPVNETSTLWQKEAEWLLSTRSLCAWIESVADLELMQINAGLLRKADWKHVAFKGGSETGVLNLTTQATDAEGRVFCVSMTWNADKVLDEKELYGPYISLFRALADR